MSDNDITMGDSSSPPEFKLSDVLEGHSGKDVRCVATTSDDAIITGGRDSTLQIWELAKQPNGGAAWSCSCQTHHTSWVNAVCAMPPIPTALNPALRDVGGIAAGLQDGSVCIHDRQGQMLYMLTGHTSQVSSLSMTSNGLLVSGSWDGTMRVWDLSTEKSVHTQSEFENAVTVLGLPNGDIATGSAGVQTGPSQVGAMKIRVFTPSLEGVNSSSGSYVLSNTVEDHQHKITELCSHGVGFASTSNDGTTRLRTSDGAVVQEIINPTGEWGLSVTSLAGTGELAVAHDDGVLQIWAGDQLQQMCVHPRGIWSVKQLNNGDLVTGCPQGKITVWSRDVARHSTAERISQYNQATFSARSLIAAKTGKQLDVSTLPRFEERLQHVGGNDGDTRQFNKSGVAYTYRWDGTSRSWVEMGQSTGAAQQEVDGKYYDRVLPVEIDLPGKGLTSCKLGFNDGDNPYLVAQKFCAKHKIDSMQVQQIVDFINQNRAVTGTTLGENAGNYSSDMTMSQLGEGGVLDMAALMGGGGGGGAVAGASGAGSSASSTYEGKQTPRSERWPSPNFPQRLGLPFDSSKKGLAGMTKVLLETSSTIHDDMQQSTLSDLLETIGETSRYHASKVSDQAVRLVVATMSGDEGIECPEEQLFPFMDLLRGCSLHRDFLERLCSLYSLEQILTVWMKTALSSTVKTAHSYLFLQLLANLLNSEISRDAALEFLACEQVGMLGPSAGLSTHKHKHVLNGYATVLLNLSVYVLNEQEFGPNRYASMFAQDIVDRCVEMMGHTTTKAAAAAGDAKKMAPMLVIAKRAYVAAGTVRVREKVTTDTSLITNSTNEIKKLDASWSSFLLMAEGCIRQHEKK